MRAIVLAGGKGTRLRPFTYSLPKPLMPLGGEMPILEIILKQLKSNDFNHITIAVNYKAKIIQAFFEDGNECGLKIDYSIEKEPLGSVGPLTLIQDLPDNFLVMNGDILTDLSFKELFNWHLTEGNDISVCTFKKKYQIDLGVIQYDNNQNIYEFVEKPVVYNNINMGVYVLNKKVIQDLTKNKPYGFDKLIINGLNQKLKIKAYVHKSYWLDIGSNEDYQKANEFYIDNKDNLFNLKT